VRRFERVLSLTAAAALFAMMVLTFVDVFGRKFLDASLPGSLELTELLMLIVIFVALPLTSLHGEHVVFDLLDRALGRGARALQHRLSNGLCAVLMLGAAWLVRERAARTAEFGDTTAQLHIGMAPFHYMVAIALVIAAMVHFALMLRVPGRDGDGAGH